MSGPAWDAAKGASVPSCDLLPKKKRTQPTTRAGRRTAKRERLGALPRGLAYLAKLLDDPRTETKLQAFRRYVKHRTDTNAKRGSIGRTTALDRARAAEYADGRRGNPQRLIRQRQVTELPAAVVAIILQLAIASDTTAKTITESLILIGLESIADDLRSQGTVRNVATISSPQSSSYAPI